jgi:hypothetical protein
MKTAPCTDCPLKYKCEEQRLACTQFRLFVEKGVVVTDTHRNPTRAVYIDVFYTGPKTERRHVQIQGETT